MCACVALECGEPVLPTGVSVEECPRRPVYGDLCIFRCAADTAASSSSTSGASGGVSGDGVVRSARSCEVKDFNTPYWSGQFPRCAHRGQCFRPSVRLSVNGA